VPLFLVDMSVKVLIVALFNLRLSMQKVVILLFVKCRH
jgi:hypothetical protein